MTKVVAAVLARSMDEMLSALRSSTDGADLVELRVDAMRNPDLDRLRAERTKPLILTCRPARQGGLFEGSEEDRRALLRRALQLGFDYVDIEMDSAGAGRVEARSRSKLILSHHDFERLPTDLPALARRAIELGADLVKVAGRVRSLAEGLELAEAAAPVRERGLGFIPVALGPAGIAARVLSARLGADFVYAAARGFPPSGPGQLGLDELLATYRFRAIGRRSEIYGLLGLPAATSLSPAIHNSSFARLGLDAVYLPFEEESLELFLPAARKLGVAGLSVTRPYKEAILPLLEDLDEGARRIGAVNTVAVRDGRWVGFNTDIDGVVLPLEKKISIRDKLAVVLGAGGAARAAAFGLAGSGARVVVLARRVEKARSLALEVGAEWGRLEDIGQWPGDILVNATPVGSRPLAGETPVAPTALREGALLLDMVYDPEETALMKAAREAGMVVIAGLQMLLTQAFRQIEIWKGVRPPAEEMERAARAELRRRSAGKAADEPLDRYSRQILFGEIGEEGQRRIRRARVMVVGVGALGSVSSEMLVRAGVGFLRLVDRDYLEKSNLQRQSLYDEEDLEKDLPKAVAAAAKLARINRQVEIEPRVEDLGPENVEELVADIDLILDGTDNFETRYLLNDASVKAGKCWIYAACVGSYGVCFVIRPGKSACLRCLMEEEPPPGATPTCDTAGIIAPAVHAVAAFQVAEALKILAGREEKTAKTVLSVDVWSGKLDHFSSAGSRPDCPTCARRQFDYLSGKGRSRTTTLCGRDAVQVRPASGVLLSLEEVASRLRPLGEVSMNPYLLRFKADGKTLVLFADGRAIVHGTDNPAEARSLYSRYVGL